MGVAIASHVVPDLGKQSKGRRVLDAKIEQQNGASIRIRGAHRLAMTWHEYLEATKHSVESLRRARQILDWADMPDPFRHYEGVPVLDLPADPPAPEIPALDLRTSTFVCLLV